MQRRHDPTFWLSTGLLPKDVRPAVHALYGFVRTADEIVDGDGRALPPGDRVAALERLREELSAAMEGEPASSDVVVALADAGRRHDLPLDELDRYIDSMARDALPVRIVDWGDLESYMEGSAGSVGRIMAPLLGASQESAPSFGQLGLAFQLTNFLRDIPQDTALDRIYLPADELAAAGVSRHDLLAAQASDGLRRVVARQVVRARELFAAGDRGCRDAIPAASRGIAVARGVYEGTLDRIEELGFDTLAARAALPPRQRIAAMYRGLRGAR